RAETQQRLMRVATLSLDEQPGCAAARLADGRVAAAPKVEFERLIGNLLVVRLDDERVRLPIALETWLADAAQLDASKQPLDLARARALAREYAAHLLEAPVLGDRDRLQLGAGDRLRSGDPGQVFESAPRTIDGAHDACAESTGRRVAQSDDGEDLGDVRGELREAAAVSFQIARKGRRVLLAWIEQNRCLLHIAISRIGARDAVDREVGA